MMLNAKCMMKKPYKIGCKDIAEYYHDTSKEYYCNICMDKVRKYSPDAYQKLETYQDAKNSIENIEKELNRLCADIIRSNYRDYDE